MPNQNPLNNIPTEGSPPARRLHLVHVILAFLIAFAIIAYGRLS